MTCCGSCSIGDVAGFLISPYPNPKPCGARSSNPFPPVVPSKPTAHVFKQPDARADASRGASRARGVARNIRPETEGVGNAGCRLAPAASRGKNKNHTSVVTARTTGITRHSRTRMVLTVSFVLSPAIGLFVTVTLRGVKGPSGISSPSAKLDSSVEESRPHDFAVRVSAVRL
jgi:hypothetical protein